MITGTTLFCHWCGISLANATCITYLNGNLPVCDLCLMKAKNVQRKPTEYCWCGGAHRPEDHRWD